jgi:hypothetical protein
MILTEDDLPIFAAGVNLTGDAAEGALWYLQSILEGDAGAGRPIELAQDTEIGTIDVGTQSFFLRRFPWVVDEDRPMTIEVRTGGNITDAYRRVVPVNQWRSLDTDDYILDGDGRVYLDINHIGLLNSYWSHGLTYSGYGVHMGSTPNGFTAYRATYWAGFDFNTSGAEVSKLKAAAGSILTYLTHSGVFKGVSELDVPFDEFRIKYASAGASMIGRIPEDMLMPFRALRARGF